MASKSTETKQAKSMSCRGSIGSCTDVQWCASTQYCNDQFLLTFLLFLFNNKEAYCWCADRVSSENHEGCYGSEYICNMHTLLDTHNQPVETLILE